MTEDEIVDLRERLQAVRLAPAVAGLVEVEIDAVAAQIDDVGGAGAVDVGELDAPRVELIGIVEPWRIVHGHFGAEAAVAEVGPVADFAVADAHQIAEAIAAQVGEMNRVLGVGEDQARSFFFIPVLRHPLRRTETVLG